MVDSVNIDTDYAMHIQVGLFIPTVSQLVKRDTQTRTPTNPRKK